MKKTYKMALVSALTLFSLSATPLVLNDHLNVAQAAATKKTHHKKVRKHAAKKHKVAKKQATKKKAAKKLRYKKAKKHVARKKATRKFSYKKAKKHVIKKKFTKRLHYKKAKKVVAKKKATKKRSYRKIKKVTAKKINHKRSRKAVAKKQNNASANASDVKSQSNLNSNANINPVENNTNNNVIPQDDAFDNNANTADQNNFNSDTNIVPVENNTNNNTATQNSTSNTNDDTTNQNNNDNVKPDVTTPTKSDNNETDDVNNYIKVPNDYFIKFVNGQYEINNKPFTVGHAFHLPVKKIESAYEINDFHSNSQDENTSVDYNSLTKEQQRDLSQYAANIINNVRHQITNNHPITADLTVDDNTINFVNDVVKRYNDDNWSIKNHYWQGTGHDVKAINQAADEFGLKSSNDYNTQDDQQFYEDAGAGDLPDNHQTHLSTIKQAIYNTIMRMLFDDADSGWGHTFSLLGNNLTGQPGEKANTFAVGFDKLGQIHFETIPYSYVKANSDAELTDNKNVAKELYDEEQKGIQPHVSTDQPFNIQFAEFQNILISNESHKLQLEGHNTNFNFVIDYYRNTVTIYNDVDYPNGKTFAFDPNIKPND